MSTLAGVERLGENRLEGGDQHKLFETGLCLLGTHLGELSRQRPMVSGGPHCGVKFEVIDCI